MHSYESGIWQIYRVLHYTGRNAVTGSEQNKTRIFSKRFVLNSFKRSFKAECCDPSFVQKLDTATSEKLTKFIKENRALYKSFCEHEPAQIDAVYNARIRAPDKGTIEAIEARLSDRKLLNELEIDKYLRESGFDTEGFPCWTVQFVSKDHECQNGYLVYRFHRVLSF